MDHNLNHPGDKIVRTTLRIAAVMVCLFFLFCLPFCIILAIDGWRHVQDARLHNDGLMFFITPMVVLPVLAVEMGMLALGIFLVRVSFSRAPEKG
jgi:hypothetical protein